MDTALGFVNRVLSYCRCIHPTISVKQVQILIEIMENDGITQFDVEEKLILEKTQLSRSGKLRKLSRKLNVVDFYYLFLIPPYYLCLRNSIVFYYIYQQLTRFMKFNINR